MANSSPKRRRTKDLSGLWTGFYAYDLTDDAIMFTAWLKEEDGEVTGNCNRCRSKRQDVGRFRPQVKEV